MAISEDLKDRILHESDIVDVIGDYVDLKKRGTNFLGLCPFHSEKTPSFTVSQEKGIFKCFGCGKAGNSASFLMEHTGMTFPEALKELAKKAGIPYEEEALTVQRKQELTHRDLVLESLKKAAGYYSKLLYTTGGKTVLNYFRKRGFSDTTIKEFMLGCAPDSWDEIKTRLGNEFNEEILFEAGLLVKNEEKNSLYDRFRNRAIFPIFDNVGKVVGFGARALSNDDGAKYINSPQSIVYDKSNSLYGFFQAKNEIRSKSYAILTEGYADVISLHQAGFKTAVASSGTSLTKEQLIILKRLCNRLYFVYDSDPAGMNATRRGLEMALELGFDLNIVTLPEGEDPDSIIQKHGANVFRKYIDESLQFIEFIFLWNKRNNKLNSPLGKAEAVRETVKLISKIADRLQHDFYISKLKELYDLSSAQIKEIYLEKSIQEKKIRQKISNSITKDVVNKEIEEKVIEETDKPEEIAIQLFPEESYLLELLVSNPGSIDILKQKYYLSSEIFSSDKGKELFLKLDMMHEDGLDLAKDIFTCEDLSPEERNFLSKFCINRETPSELWKKYNDGEEILKTDESMYRYVLLKPVLKNIERRIRNIQQYLNELPFEMQVEQLKDLRKLQKKKEEINKVFLELKKC